MIVSTWRYGHFILAISSFLFLIVVALTGIILAVEPIEERLNIPATKSPDKIRLADLVGKVQDNYEEVFSIRKEPHGWLHISVLNQNAIQEFYIDPDTTEKIQGLKEKRPLYQFALSLHRSLFIGTTGRVLVGINSLILLLLAISGICLISRKQGGWKKYFNKIEKTKIAHYYHTALGRIFILPITFLAITGIYLSLNRFIEFSNYKVSHQVDYENVKESPKSSPGTFRVFNGTTLADFKELEFPFSDDPEDFYTLKLKKGELLINQYTGEIISEFDYPMMALISQLMNVLHTGEGNVLLAIINGFSSVGIIAFIFTGLFISIKGRSRKVKNPFKVSDCEYVILYGSENGSTAKYAAAFQHEMLKADKKCHIASLNEFKHFRKLKHLIIFTSTYGQGEAPENALKFQKRFNEFSQFYLTPFSYSIMGFGSTAYPEFCQYAFDINELLKKSEIASEFIPIHTIDNQSIDAVNGWLDAWSERAGIAPTIRLKTRLIAKKRTLKFTVLERLESPNQTDNTFILKLCNKKQIYQSGDLLGIYAPGENRERYYSVGKVNGGQPDTPETLLISVKKHKEGVCSNYLSKVSCGANISGFLVTNEKFHLPGHAKKVLMICNGTGIAPFLGMINENHPHCKKYLYWGGQNNNSFKLYEELLSDSLDNGSLKKITTAFSRSGKNPMYVQQRLKKDSDFISEALNNGGVIMICGSLNMLNGVKEVLSNIVSRDLRLTLEHFENNNQLMYDCY